MRQVGRYKLIRPLGAGGMGQVFAATDGDDQRPVAIKVIRGPHAANEATRIRFVREAHAAGQLQHPNIVTVHDIGQAGGALYIVMEYLQGFPLTRFLGPSSLSLQAKLSILMQSADALGYAHCQGVVHRDVKPANIVVLDDQSVKMVDFGIAGLVDLPNSIVQGSGTIPYMSPEQLARQNLDGRSDIWSLGVTMFELLTGMLPYRNFQEIKSAPPPELPSEFPLCSELNAVLARALAKDRQMRYQLAEQLGADLRKLQQTSEAASRTGDQDHKGAALFAATLNHTILGVVGGAGSGRAAPEESRTVPRPALLDESTSAGGSYALPSLNFSRHPEGELVTGVGRFAWKERVEKLPQRWIQQMRREFSKLLVRSLPPTWPLLLVLFLVAIVVGSPALAVSMMVCYLFAIRERRPVCKRCRMRMKGTARWTRLCKSREEVIFGYRDCMAALRHRLWQDAAKLLSLYGAESVSEYGSRFIPPIKYHLTFFECKSCGHHAARLTGEEMIEGQWELQTEFEQAYWGGNGDINNRGRQRWW